jgi:hypothetical protein
MAEVNVQPPKGENEKPPSIFTNKGSPLLNHDEDVTLTDALFHQASEAAPVAAEDKGFLHMVQGGYEQDALFAIILEKPREHKGFTIHDNLIWCKNIHDDKVLCIPRNPKVITTVLDQAHATLGHFGDQLTAEYIQ